MTTTEKLLLTDKDVAELLSCSRGHVWKSAKAGKLPQPVKFNGVTRWKRSEIQQVVDGLEAA